MSIDRRRVLLLTGGAALAASGLGVASAHEYRKGGLEVEHPWLRAPRDGESEADLFMAVYNRGDAADRLIAVKSPEIGGFALHVAPHFAVATDAIFFPNGSKVALAPGGSFIRLSGIEKINPVGWGFEVTLVFEKAGELPIEASIDAPDAAHAHDAEATERWEKAHGRGVTDTPQEGAAQGEDHRSGDEDMKGGGEAPPAQ
ncbi:copper chaperone PCu(A)C [Methylosinus sporium]|uniref:Copper chaperone PCu(A)C n=1 Tax=Methylosinus sporium TaxID=428 RepID=A0A549T412_METSR|nr:MULTISPECIES: copper chaperone PCu(A)C [Methylosinus]MBU3886871.1 copper chaperone PCu(A)C [Methylosinus sp. KRF6]TRL36530.1 copper chaperone PCu(A)C [Methylosinus sporium]